MHQQTLMLAGKLCAPLLGGGVAQVKIAIHEVGNHFDGMAHVKLDHRAVAQVIGDGSHAVALLDAEAGYRQIGTIGADERNVGAVQRGHKRQAPRTQIAGRSQHLPRQQRAHRMRNCVVDVQQVEPINLRHFRHARGQRQIVRRIFEQRIPRDFHLMVVNLGVRLGEPNGQRVGDEMHFVAALCQLHPQLGGDDAAAAVGGITGDAYFHVLFVSRAQARGNPN